VGGVGRDVPTFLWEELAGASIFCRCFVTTCMIGVDNKIQPHKINKILVVSEAKLVGQVETVILVRLDGSDLSVLEDVAIDLSSDGRKLGDQVHGILEGIIPVFRFVKTLGICLCELGLMFESSHSKRELRHWVESVGASVDKLLDKLGNRRTGSPLGRELTSLLLSRNLPCQKQPEDA